MDIMLAIAGIVTLSLAFLYIGQYFKIPGIVSFLVIGRLAGPYGFAIITDQTADRIRFLFSGGKAP